MTLRALLCLTLLLLGSCNGTDEPRPQGTVTTSSTPATAATSATDKKIEELKKQHAEALKEGNKVAALEAERDLYKALESQRRMEADQFKSQAKETDRELKQARVEAQQTKLYWISGICLLLALAATALAIFLPLVRKYAVMFVIAAVGVAALAYVFAWMIPYLIWIGLGLAALGAVAVVFWWRKDFTGFSQVIQAVNPLKTKLGDYKTHFRQYIDTESDKQIDKIRKLEEQRIESLARKQRLAEAKRASS